MIIKEHGDGLRIEGIPDIMPIRENLKTRGSFDNSYSLYTIKTPLGEITFRTDWWPTSVDVWIKKKPFFVSEKLIYEHLRQEVEKATVSP